MHLLIIDSSAEVMERLHELLSEEAAVWTVHRAFSCEEASHMMHRIHPAVVLLDSTVYKCSKGELLRNINEEKGAIAFIVLTNGGDDLLFRRFKLLDTDFLIDKYNEFEKIPAIVNTIAARKGHHIM